jgi:hypothetical protein
MRIRESAIDDGSPYSRIVHTPILLFLSPRVLANPKSSHGDFVHDRHQSRTNAGLRRRVTSVVDDDES